MKNRLLGIASALVLGLVGVQAQAQDTLPPDKAKFRALYKEMVETDTSITTGSCTALAGKLEAHMLANGFQQSELTRFSVPEHPKEGGLVAVYPGTSKTLKPMLLLGHIDVVVAKREDWTRDPYTLFEEDGYFYGRGTSDMKALAAIWVDMLERFRAEGYKPKRTIKLALTCGEETSWAFNGARWLTENRRDLIDAEFVLNEGGGGRTDGKGTVVAQNFHVGEKTVGNYRIEATNPGGHSSIPIRDNAIYELSDALVKLREFEFPVMLNDTTRAYFSRLGAGRTDEMGKAMLAVVANPQDKAAVAVLDKDRMYHSMLRTTCVATQLDGGHANNALPQRAGALINCRIFPGVGYEEVRKTLEQVIADPRSVPLVPMMSTGGTDGIYFGAIGIPSYGPPGLYGDPDGNGAHGLNERAIVKAVYTGRDMLTELVKAYASPKGR
ncbi:MAG: M20/M25/M40 family metallo-hydrolase [Novosphingobium sp.]|nr:M20/M25/M40 family metallo-hydrolase [Novosphingobium sp.]